MHIYIYIYIYIYIIVFVLSLLLLVVVFQQPTSQQIAQQVNVYSAACTCVLIVCVLLVNSKFSNMNSNMY